MSNCHLILFDSAGELRSCFQQLAMDLRPARSECPAHWRQDGIPTTRPWNKNIPGMYRSIWR
ncbi:hypothetical protein PSPO01_15013 [Paraphaeosphaeria sporulosa]